MAKNKVMFIKPGSMGQPVSDYEKQRREKIELNNLRLVEMGFQRMANSLVDLRGFKGKNNSKDDEEYQPLEDEHNLSFDDHLSSYSDEEELIDAISNERRKKNVVAQHTSTPHTEMPPMQSIVPPPSTQGSMPTSTIESTVAPTPTQDLLVEQRTLSTTPTTLPQDMVRGRTLARWSYFLDVNQDDQDGVEDFLEVIFLAVTFPSKHFL